MRFETSASDRVGREETEGQLVPCPDHGPSLWCYVQRDGSHLDQEACLCLSYPSHACPVDAHRASASGGEALDEMVFVQG